MAVDTKIGSAVVGWVAIGFFGLAVTGPAGFVNGVNGGTVGGVLVKVAMIAEFHGSGVDKFVKGGTASGTVVMATYTIRTAATFADVVDEFGGGEDGYP